MSERDYFYMELSEDVTLEEVAEMKDWCLESLGQFQWFYFPAKPALNKPHRFRFYKEEDLAFFKLTFDLLANQRNETVKITKTDI